MPSCSSSTHSSPSPTPEPYVNEANIRIATVGCATKSNTTSVPPPYFVNFSGMMDLPPVGKPLPDLPVGAENAWNLAHGPLQDGTGIDSAPLPEKPFFSPLSARQMSGNKVEFRKVFVPAHRYTPLKENWMALYTPITEQMKIDVRMNLKVGPH